MVWPMLTMKRKQNMSRKGSSMMDWLSGNSSSSTHSTAGTRMEV